MYSYKREAEGVLSQAEKEITDTEEKQCQDETDLERCGPMPGTPKNAGSLEAGRGKEWILP